MFVGRPFSISRQWSKLSQGDFDGLEVGFSLRRPSATGAFVFSGSLRRRHSSSGRSSPEEAWLRQRLRSGEESQS
ncbi:hypothetical protein U1Q18_046147 [Sarracenia purpurea var. burkii]